MKLPDARNMDVWRVKLDVPTAGVQVLSAEERARAGRFLAERDARRYVNAHVALRDILARYVECAPQALAFRVNEYGKPTLAMETDVEFNLAHSGEVALVALMRGMAVGVDVEEVRAEFGGMDLAQRFFAAREVEILAQEPERFFEFWTRKEAFIKAIGMGVSFPLQAFDVCERQVRFMENAPERGASDWFVTSFLGEDYVGALAAPVKDVMVRHFEWERDSELFGEKG